MTPDSDPRRPGVLLSIRARATSVLNDLQAYVVHSAFLPSFALSLLYLTVLSFNGQMVAYLLSIKFSSTSIGLLRTLSTSCELSATWLAPRTMDRIGAVRAGIWFLNWQIACLALAIGMLWARIPPEFASAGFLAGVVASRVGLWGLI
ncbi:hypothetical protein H2203_003138 [Taxawa tesnikishii (nom. ined.)]|nr:hypothetical protein H2203_003138 [Dothideales sp. JES 119]